MLFSRISGFDSDNLKKLPAGYRWKIEIFSIWTLISIFLSAASACYIFFVSTKSLIISGLAGLTVFICFISIQNLLISNRGKQIGEDLLQEESDRINHFHSWIYLALTLLFTQPILLYAGHQIYRDKVPFINQIEYDVRLQSDDNLHKGQQNDLKHELAIIREKINSLGGDLSIFISEDDLQILSSSTQPGDNNKLNNPYAPRKALIIGNKSYAPPQTILGNTLNDAREMSKSLAKMGFQVTTLYEVNHATMEFQINQFVNSLQAGDISLIYYSGHGNQFNGVNYLFPIDNAQYQINKYLSQVNSKKVLASIVILDACRGDGKRVERNGFDTTGAGDSYFIGLAASAGETSSDGRPGGNGEFTSFLLKNINLKTDIKDVFEKTRQEVIRFGSGQHPDYINQLSSNFILSQKDSKPLNSNNTESNSNSNQAGKIPSKSTCEKNFDWASSEKEKDALLTDCIADFLKLFDDLKENNKLASDSKIELEKRLKDRFEGDFFNPMYFYKYIWSNTHINIEDEFEPEIPPITKAILFSLFIWFILAGGFLLRENLSLAQLQYRQFRNEEDSITLYNDFVNMNEIAKDKFERFKNEIKKNISSQRLIREDLSPDLPHPYRDSKDAIERSNKYLRTDDEAFNYLKNLLGPKK